MEIIRDIDNSNLPPCVATIGFFDGVHRGHRFLIGQMQAEARKEGLCTTLVTFSEHPRKVMQQDYCPRLLSTPEEKVALLAHAGVDYCVLLRFTQEMARLTASEFMERVLKDRLHVKTLFVGYDHRFGHNRSEGFEDYRRHGHDIGMEVVQADVCKTTDASCISSSAIRSFLLKGDVAAATQRLGYAYSIEGTVVDGYKVGRTIGFPTANITVDNPDKLLPADGVYAVRVTITGKTYQGMLDIGHRPTFNGDGRRSIEVHILDFSSDIYRQAVRLHFIQRIRSDIRFANVEGLIAQLHDDEEQVRRILSRSDTQAIPLFPA